MSNTTPGQAKSLSLPPANRIVAFIGPFVAIVAGALAAWLGKHFPGLHLNMTKTAAAITQAIEFAVGAAVTLALHSKWLEGWQKWESATSQPSTQPPPAPAPAPASLDTAYGQGTPSDG